ncbi:MAG: ATP-binding protein [Thermodesulfobacteria bacterium]|nr:ATP-binding protein [Thermodesulfobacteriota bacterium]
MENPFIYQRPIRYGEPFCNREKEISYLENGVFSAELVCLASIRRMGKTSLINQLEGRLGEKVEILRIDLSDVFKLEDFVRLFERALGRISPQEKILHHLKKVLSLRPELELGLDVSTGDLKLVPRLVSEKDSYTFFREILRTLVRFAEKEKRPFWLVIDEFQNVRRISPKGEIEWTMRRVFEERKSFFSALFAGSERSLLLQMVNDDRAAFYRMVTVYECDPLPLKEAEDFVVTCFKETLKRAPKRELVRKLLEIIGGHPYAMNLFFHRLWREASLKKKIINDPRIWGELLEELVILERKRFEDLNSFLSLKARELLKAIAIYGPVSDPYSAAFLQKTGLTASTVQKTLKTLLRHNRIRETPQGYQVADPLEKLVIRLSGVPPEELRRLFERTFSEI